MVHDLIVIGGGAAGFFTAIQYAEVNPGRKVRILESSKRVLSKVEISGGGRCNVTHACFDPREMTGYYPRGNKELLGPFNRFLCGDMMGWLEERGVPVKIEEDGRVFPVSDDSKSIIELFLSRCKQYGIGIETGRRVDRLQKEADLWVIGCGQDLFRARQVMWATGSSPAAWKLLAGIGHTIVDPVPSLFTFNIREKALHQMAGISVPSAQIYLPGQDMSATGPLLITHWGLSGPAVLRLSAWGARELHASGYKFDVRVSWTGWDPEGTAEWISQRRQLEGARLCGSSPPEEVPKRLWQYILKKAGCTDLRWADLTRENISRLTGSISEMLFHADGKSTFKEEFVTCGGVDTREVDFRTMESRIHQGLYLAGEVLNIDAVTGGFNFQAAWTESFIAARAMS